MKTCYIVAAAELAEERLRPEEGDLVIAADAGLRHLARLGIQPDLALGDFDSLGYVPEAPSVEVCPVRKETRTPWPRSSGRTSWVSGAC